MLLALNVVFHIGQAAIHFPEISLYRNRTVVVDAIRAKEPEMFAHRRAFAVDGGPALLDDKVAALLEHRSQWHSTMGIEPGHAEEAAQHAAFLEEVRRRVTIDEGPGPRGLFEAFHLIART